MSATLLFQSLSIIFALLAGWAWIKSAMLQLRPGRVNRMGRFTPESHFGPVFGLERNRGIFCGLRGSGSRCRLPYLRAEMIGPFLRWQRFLFWCAWLTTERKVLLDP
jgi:hypothetical protein